MTKVMTKELIIEKALKVFLLKGYDRATMNDVVNESGITKGGIYHHFKNKDDLFLTIIMKITSSIEEWIQKLFMEAKTIEELIRAYFISASEVMTAFMNLCPDEEVTSVHYYQFMIDSIKRFDSVKDMMGESYTHIGNMLSGQILLAQQRGDIRNDINAENLAFHLNALMEGMINMTVAFPEMDLVEKGNQLFEDFWKMLKK